MGRVDVEIPTGFTQRKARREMDANEKDFRVVRVGLFIPCYIDQFYPQVGRATFELLQKLGCEVVYPEQQTCCGQPMANSGYAHLTKGCDKNFISCFSEFEYVVAPSGSCVLHIKEHLVGSHLLKSRTFELCEFLTDVMKVEKLNVEFPYKVGLHTGCHGQRGLRLSSMSELRESAFSKPEQLLSLVKGIQVIKPTRVDECCGFGGTFCVNQAAVSVAMGKDQIKEHEANGVDFITSADSSCLMHLEGILRRNQSTIEVRHIAEILNNSQLS